MYKILSQKIIDHFDQFIDYFGLSFYEDSRSYTSNCWVHGGDNPSALVIYKNNSSCPGCWKCFTHNCQEKFQKNAFGFVHALLCKDQPVDESYTKKFVLSVLGEENMNLSISQHQQDKERFVSLANHFIIDEDLFVKIPTQDILNYLDIPSQYYLNRGYSRAILEKYQIGDCTTKTNMRNRAVIPIFDENKIQVVGYTGRSIFNQCGICGMYHPISSVCPPQAISSFYSKWKHNFGFSKQDFLFNLWVAKQSIQETETAILVESPGNALRLAEASIYNVLAIMGTSLGFKQRAILGQSGAFNVVVIMDNDKNGAGQEAAQNIMSQLQRTYRVTSICPTTNDLGDMTTDQIQTEIAPQIKDFVDRCVII